jgi:hypothetical protein
LGRALPFLPLLLLLAGSAGVSAQIVNIENILAGDPEEGIEGVLQLGWELKEGNSEYLQMDASGLIRWHGGVHIVQLVLGGSYRTAQENKVSDSALGHVRYGYELSSRLRLEALVQVQKDAFIRLRQRVLVGAGVRANVLSSSPSSRADSARRENRLDIGLIFMHESEELRGAVSEPGMRASLLISTGLSLTETADLGSQIYIQPALSDLDDVRLLGDGGLTLKVLGPLSLQLIARVVYDSRPPPGVESTDYLLRNTVVLAF